MSKFLMPDGKQEIEKDEFLRFYSDAYYLRNNKAYFCDKSKFSENMKARPVVRKYIDIKIIRKNEKVC